MTFFDNPIAPVAKKYSIAYLEINRVFNGEWNDPVHDTYFRYIKFCNESASSLNSMAYKLEEMIHELNKIEVEKLLDESEKLHEKIEEILKHESQIK